MPAAGAPADGPPSPDKAAGEGGQHHPLLEPQPPAPIDIASAINESGAPVTPLAVAVGLASKDDTEMDAPAAEAKRAPEEDALACYQNWAKVARIQQLESKGKGKGKNGNEPEKLATATA